MGTALAMFAAGPQPSSAFASMRPPEEERLCRLYSCARPSLPHGTVEIELRLRPYSHPGLSVTALPPAPGNGDFAPS